DGQAAVDRRRGVVRVALGDAGAGVDQAQVGLGQVPATGDREAQPQPADDGGGGGAEPGGHGYAVAAGQVQAVAVEPADAAGGQRLLQTGGHQVALVARQDVGALPLEHDLQTGAGGQDVDLV